MQPALVLENVTKHYAGHLAVDRLSLVVPRGTVYGILGPNGAGKSSTLRMALNIIGRDAGRVALLGRDPESDPAVLRRVGYLPEERGLYLRMRVLDVVVFFARLKGMRAADARLEGERWLERLGLGDRRRDRLETLSKGMQQKVQFITTVVHAPDLLVLDEPSSGLDPVNRQVLHDEIRAARARGRTVILSTHSMEQAEELCDAVCIIAGGRKVLDGELRAIRSAHRGDRWHLEFADPTDAARDFVYEAGWLTAVVPRGDGWEGSLAPGRRADEMLGALSRLPAPLVRLERVRPSLHDIFLEHVGATGATRLLEGADA